MTPTSPTCPWWQRPLIWIIVLGFVLRLISMSFNYPQMRWQNDNRMAIPAVRILEGKGFSLEDGAGPTAYRPPAYVLWLSGAYALFGKFSLLGPSFLQVLVSTLNIYLMYLLTRQVWKQETVALWASGLLAVHPYSIYHDPALYHTFLSTACLLSSLFFLCKALAPTRPATTSAQPHLFYRDYILSGICFGTCILIISTIVPWLVLLIASGVFLWRIRFRQRLALVGCFVLGLLIPWGPWMIRNALAFHHFIPLTTESGVTLWEGNNPESAQRLPQRSNESAPVPKGTKFNLPDHYEGCQPAGWCQGGVSEYEESNELTGMAIAWIQNHPRQFVSLTLWRFKGIWWPFLTPPKQISSFPVLSHIIVYGYAVWNLSLFSLVVFGTYLSLGRNGRSEDKTIYPLFAWTLALSGTAAYALFLFYTKYRIPFEATLIPLAGLGLSHAWRLATQLSVTRFSSAPTRSSYHAD